MPKGKRIVIVLPFNAPGSLQRKTIILAEDLVKKLGYHVWILAPKSSDALLTIDTLLTIDKYSNLHRRIKFVTINVSRPKMFSSLDNLKNNMNYLLAFTKDIVRSLKLYKRIKPDLILVIGLVALQEAIAAIIYDRHKFIWNLIGNIYPKFLIFLLFPIMRLASRRIFIANSLRRYYLGKKTDPIAREFIVEDYGLLNYAERKYEKVSEKLPTSNNIILGTLCFLTPIKGIHYIIESIRKLKKEGVNVRFYIIGDVPSKRYYRYKAYLLKMVTSYGLQDQIKFLGFLSEKRKIQVLSEIDIFVLASEYEGTPVSLIEAMMLKKPIIATRVGGIPEMVIHGYNGLLVPPKNPFALYSAIKTLLKEKKLIMRFSKNSLKIAKCLYSYKKNIERYLNIIEDSLRNTR